jgi:hypothetical protein
MVSTYSSIVGHFDGHVDAWVQGCLYHPMQHVKGYTVSLWTPPLGNYLLHIALVAARATSKQTTINKYTKKGGHLDCRSGAPERYCMHLPIEEA